MRLPLITILAGFSFTLLSACGGGGGGGGLALSSPGGGGIGGTGVTSSGTIDGFGSIFVNGVEFETDSAEIILDGQSGSEADLGLGMVVLVTGTINEDGSTGNAARVIFDDEIQGPIGSIVDGVDGDARLLDILGIEVIAERTGTVYEGVTFDTLAVGDQVEVSGFPNEDGQLRATRIEKQSDFTPGSSQVERKGVVSNLSGTTFTLGTFLVDFSNADLTDLPGGTVSDGLTVEVRGTLIGDLIEADRVEEEEGISDFLERDEDVEVEGTITEYVSNRRFRVNGVLVDASGATLRPQGLSLGNGVIVEVEGVWNGSILVADEVEARRGRIEIEAPVASVDVASGMVTLQFFPGQVNFEVDDQTRLEDSTGIEDDLDLADLSSGEFLAVEAFQSGSGLVATLLDREERGDDIIQAPVEDFTPGADVTLLGVTYSTLGTDFQNERDERISSDAFFSQLKIGDLVKVRDDDTADGIADEIEFEQAGELDGDREFDDDCDSSRDDSDDNSNGTCGSGLDDDREDNSGSDSRDDDKPDDDSSGSGSGDDSEPDTDNSGSGSRDDSEPDIDNSGSGSGDDSEPDIDNSGSGSSDDSEPDTDNSGSGSGDDSEPDIDNSGSGSSDDAEPERD